MYFSPALLAQLLPLAFQIQLASIPSFLFHLTSTVNVRAEEIKFLTFFIYLFFFNIANEKLKWGNLTAQRSDHLRLSSSFTLRTTTLHWDLDLEVSSTCLHCVCWFGVYPLSGGLLELCNFKWNERFHGSNLSSCASGCKEGRNTEIVKDKGLLCVWCINRRNCSNCLLYRTK